MDEMELELKARRDSMARLKIDPVEMGPMGASFLRMHLRTLPVQARSSLPPSMRLKVVALIVESEYC